MRGGFETYPLVHSCPPGEQKGMKRPKIEGQASHSTILFPKDIHDCTHFSAILKSTEEHIIAAMNAQESKTFNNLVLLNAHGLNQTSESVSFRLHTDQEENIPLNEANPRIIILTTVILLRRGDAGPSGVRVAGASEVATYNTAGDGHCLLSELYHETIPPTHPQMTPGQAGDVKIAFFWGPKLACHKP
jgi:hypothetical protein